MVDFASSFIIHNTHALKIDKTGISRRKKGEKELRDRRE
jgi:hypothetical protein